MLLIAVAGAAVLAFVSWVSLREARRPSGTFIPDARAPAVSAAAPRADVGGRGLAAFPLAPGPGVTALSDATVSGADDAEALAAAAALWRVLVHAEQD